jgi:hypothetical protein
VPVSLTILSDAELETSEGYFNGIATRNLIHNGFFAQAAVVPFPDMQWVRNEVKIGYESEWIASYARTLTDAVLDT